MLPPVKKIFFVVNILLIVLFSTSLVFAQTNPSQFRITRQDLSDFPNNKVYFNAYNINGKPVSGLVKTDVAVFDNQVPVEFNLEEKEVGVRVLFVIDAGKGINSSGATGLSRYAEMKEFINYYMSRMGLFDTLMVLSNENGQFTSISDFGTPTEKIKEQLESYYPNPSTYSNGMMAINQALTELNNVNDDKKEFVILLTSGLELDSAVPMDLYSQTIKNIDSPIVSTVLFRGDEGKSKLRLNQIADQGQGKYLYFDNDARNNLEFFFQHIFEWHYQYEITYRIPNPTNGSHEISILNSSNTIQTTSTYTLEISEPSVRIIEPVDNQIIKQSMTDSLNIKVDVTFPDGQDRKVDSVTLWAENQVYATVSNPEGTTITIPWDSSNFKILKPSPVQFEVEITDEIGLIGRSNPVTINLQPANLTKLSLGMQIGALVLAIAAVVLVVIFRRPLTSAGGSIVQKAGEVWETITKPRRVLTAKAYLQVVAGLETETKYEIYGTTPIGRSRRNAELIFHANEENSPISRLHCTILDEEDVFYIRDDDSQWGTFLNGRKLESLEKYQLHNTDEITLAPLERGGILLRFIFLTLSTDFPEIIDDADSKIEEDIDGDITKPTRKSFN